MKDFLLICDKNCATYKEVFPLFKQGIVSFGSPVKEYEGTDRKFGNHSWITTLSVPNKKKLILTATYDPDKYPKYDNYDAIEVSRIKNIPYDYDGVMGVPITIFGYDLEEYFELKGMAAGNSAVNGFGSQAGYRKHKKDRGGCPILDDERIYTRILIRRKQDD